MGIADKLFEMKNEKAAANLKAGQDFLASNKNEEGVVETASGLQYKVLTMGTWRKAYSQQYSYLPLSWNCY
jgi:FKBP-type peptidyl-prolyl cis-trans isomerase FklB